MKYSVHIVDVVGRMAMGASHLNPAGAIEIVAGGGSSNATLTARSESATVNEIIVA